MEGVQMCLYGLVILKIEPTRCTNVPNMFIAFLHVSGKRGEKQ